MPVEGGLTGAGASGESREESVVRGSVMWKGAKGAEVLSVGEIGFRCLSLDGLSVEDGDPDVSTKVPDGAF